MTRKAPRTDLVLFLGLAISVVLGLAAATGQEPSSSRAYVGHQNDADMKGFIRQYPRASGTRLDDCQTCHRGGVKGTDTEREYNPCGYCHLLVHPNPRYATGVPKTAADTLNSYGLDYKKAGRSIEAFAAVAGLDSDGDGAANAAEVADLRNPGDGASRPGLPLAPTVSLGWDEIRKLPVQRQFMLMNKSSQKRDEYVTYTGVRIIDLLSAAKIFLTGVTGITVFAPDGYSTDHSLQDIATPFPQGFYYDAPLVFGDAEQALLEKPAAVPPGVANGHPIPGSFWLILAYERDGRPLEASAYETATGRLLGEGPYRLVQPQRHVMDDRQRPGRPDRSVDAKTYGDGWDYSDRIDHNAGAGARGACVIRVNPMPEGFEEFDWKNGWSLVGEKKVVIYGHGVR
ncbi:MAG TPA: GEGP motif-containing diheme protein [Acidobacteriota bacterium]|nr:GEGP motif-containing diheme protein [Acidobacteriota bacterium]